jgi:hypothetical protein
MSLIGKLSLRRIAVLGGIRGDTQIIGLRAVDAPQAQMHAAQPLAATKHERRHRHLAHAVLGHARMSC